MNITCYYITCINREEPRKKFLKIATGRNIRHFYFFCVFYLIFYNWHELLFYFKNSINICYLKKRRRNWICEGTFWRQNSLMTTLLISNLSRSHNSVTFVSCLCLLTEAHWWAAISQLLKQIRAKLFMLQAILRVDDPQIRAPIHAFHVRFLPLGKAASTAGWMKSKIRSADNISLLKCQVFALEIRKGKMLMPCNFMC